MRKKIIIYATLIIITLIIVITLRLFYNNFTGLKFNLNSANVHSIEYRFENFTGNENLVGETTDQDEISSIINYLNTLTLPKSSVSNDGAVEYIRFKDNDGNIIKRFGFGCGLIWDDGKPYKFEVSQTNKIKKLLHIKETDNKIP